MSEAKTVTLAGTAYPVEPMPFGSLRKVLPAMMRVGANLAAGTPGADDVGTLGDVVALGLGIEPATMEGMRIRFDDLITAFQAVLEAAGLAQKEPAPGEVQGQSSTGTSSTPNS